MRVGNRIAINKLVGGRNGKGRVHIRAIGTVQHLNCKSKRVTVRWDRTNLDREVQGHSLFQSVHGPFDAGEPVVQDVFQEDIRRDG